MSVYGCPEYPCGANTLGTRVAMVSENARLLWRTKFVDLLRGAVHCDCFGVRI
jgi:hypothetical protein